MRHGGQKYRLEPVGGFCRLFCVSKFPGALGDGLLKVVAVVFEFGKRSSFACSSARIFSTIALNDRERIPISPEPPVSRAWSRSPVSAISRLMSVSRESGRITVWSRATVVIALSRMRASRTKRRIRAMESLISCSMVADGTKTPIFHPDPGRCNT